MKKVAFLASIWMAFALSVANAHGPSRVKVEESIVINAAPADVWAIIKDFGNIHSWLPVVEKTVAEGGNKKGATRKLTLKNGGVVKEKLKSFKADKMSFSYKITEMSTEKTIDHAGEKVEVKVLPVSNYKAWMEVEADGDSASKVTWKAKFYRGYMNNNPPPELNEDAAKGAVTKFFKDGLSNLKKKIEG